MSCSDTCQIGDGKAYVSITFDDVPGSGFYNGQRILDICGCKGTFFVSGSLAAAQGKDSENYEANFEPYTLEQLCNCYAAGHEIGCHTYSHNPYFTKMSQSEFRQDLELNVRYFQQCLPELELTSFSFPFGNYNKAMKSVAKSKFRYCRSINTGVNTGRVDKACLSAFAVYEASTTVEKIREQLHRLKESGGWLILYTHDVRQGFSQYGCSPEFLLNLTELCLDLDVTIDTVTNVGDRICK